MKDTKHTLQLLKGCDKSRDIVLATADVASLYTKIDHQGAMKAAKPALKKNTSMERKQRRFILKCFDFCQSNFFWYESNYYHIITNKRRGYGR